MCGSESTKKSNWCKYHWFGVYAVEFDRIPHLFWVLLLPKVPLVSKYSMKGLTLFDHYV